MIILNENEDLLYDLDIQDSSGNKIDIKTTDLDLEMQVYTTDTSVLTYSKEDLTNNVLKVSSEDLKTLESGQIHVKVKYSSQDDSYPDGYKDTI